MKSKLSAVTLALAFVANGLAFASAVFLQNIWAVLIISGIIALDIYLFCLRSVRRRRPQYPLVPPEGKPDMYIPRTGIPRPVIEDFRKIEEKKHKFSRINRMIRRAGKRKKK